MQKKSLSLIASVLIILMSVNALAGSGGANELPEVCDHNFLHVEAKEATCTDDGNIEYYYCPACGGYFSDPNGRTEIEQEETVVKAKGHKLSENWNSDAIYHWQTCTVCGQETEKSRHLWDNGVITKKPSESETGTIVYTCSVCKATLSETVPVAGHVHIPEHIPSKTATETEPGNVEYWRCKGCGQCFSDEKCLKNIAKDSTIIPAFGDSYTTERNAEDVADALRSLSLFLGTGDNPDGTPNYSLDRGLTRAQSLVLLIRMLGKEYDATSLVYSHPFTDTDEWYNSYVGYGYHMKLTNGTGENTYSGSNPTTAQMFTTFCLRALEYNDMSADPDFYWEESCEMAAKLGIEVSTDGAYLRRDAVITFWDTLKTKMKNSDMTLADRLISEGVFTREAYDKACEIANAKVLP